jgi:hypothetical protein
MPDIAINWPKLYYGHSFRKAQTHDLIPPSRKHDKDTLVVKSSKESVKRMMYALVCIVLDQSAGMSTLDGSSLPTSSPYFWYLHGVTVLYQHTKCYRHKVYYCGS